MKYVVYWILITWHVNHSPQFPWHATDPHAFLEVKMVDHLGFLDSAQAYTFYKNKLAQVSPLDSPKSNIEKVWVKKEKIK